MRPMVVCCCCRYFVLSIASWHFVWPIRRGMAIGTTSFRWIADCARLFCYRIKYHYYYYYFFFVQILSIVLRFMKPKLIVSFEHGVLWNTVLTDGCGTAFLFFILQKANLNGVCDNGLNGIGVNALRIYVILF